VRIIGGRLGGRLFDGPASEATRPTSDRVREGIASALQARDAFADRPVLDLFAGTGGWAFEALSRGAPHAVLVDRDRRACDQIRKNIASLDLRSAATLVTTDLFRDAATLSKRIGDEPAARLVFVDPPYAEIAKIPNMLKVLIETGCIAPDALIVVERASRDLACAADFLASVGSYRYGDTAVDLFALASSTDKATDSP
jgi:16S rRNA (guanine966-N2)-methyltransferase